MEEQKIGQWLGELAARQPAPGGGAVAALMAATAAALLGMVSLYTTGEKWADRSEQMQEFSDKLKELQGRALKLADDDAQAFAKVSAAYKMPQGEQRTVAIQKALVAAAQPPAKTAQLVSNLLEPAKELAKNGNPNVISDVAVAAACAKAALEAAIVNIEINRQSIKDVETQRVLDGQVQKADKSIAEFEKVFTQVRDKINGVDRYPRPDRGSR